MAWVEPLSLAAEPRLRPARVDDLAALNAVIEAAVMGWSAPERVKRLSLPSYRYHLHDFDHLELRVAESGAAGIIGVAAWEEAAPADTPNGVPGLLLHGLYVDPAYQGRGIGARLLAAAVEAARSGGFDGLLVKANPDAQAFFARSGLKPLPIANPARDYPYRFWLALDGGGKTPRARP